MSSGHLDDAAVSKNMGVTNPTPSNVVNQREPTTSDATTLALEMVGMVHLSKLERKHIARTSVKEKKKFIMYSRKVGCNFYKILSFLEKPFSNNLASGLQVAASWFTAVVGSPASCS